MFNTILRRKEDSTTVTGTFKHNAEIFYPTRIHFRVFDCNFLHYLIFNIHTEICNF